MLFLCGNGDIAMVLLMTAIRVAVEMCIYVFNCMFCGGICSVSSGIGGSDIS